MNQQDNFEKYVDEYLNSLLHDDEVKEMEHRLETDPDFARQFGIEIQGPVDSHFQNKSFEDFFKNHEIDYDSQLRNQKKLRRLWITFVLATSFLIVVLVGYTIFIGDSKSEILFAQHFERYEQPSYQSLDKNMYLAFEFYKTKDYENAIAELERLYASKYEQKHLIEFYLGMCYLGKKNPDLEKAESFFNKVKDTKNPYVQEANWYLALTNLKGENLLEAQSRLKAIAKDVENCYQPQAIELLEAIH